MSALTLPFQGKCDDAESLLWQSFAIVDEYPKVFQILIRLGGILYAQVRLDGESSKLISVDKK